MYQEPADPAWAEAWQITEGLLRLVRDDVAAHGASLLVTTLSTGTQANPDPVARAALMRKLGVSDLFYPDLRIARAGARDGYGVLTLAPDFQRYADEHHVLLHGFQQRSVGHWNATGHGLAAQLIVARLTADLRSVSRPVSP